MCLIRYSVVNPYRHRYQKTHHKPPAGSSGAALALAVPLAKARAVAVAVAALVAELAVVVLMVFSVQLWEWLILGTDHSD